MRIRQLQLIRYGKFTNHVLELPRAEQDIHLIVGPNEAGKSTTRAALGDWLFGIGVRTPMAFLHPMPDLRLGGVLERDSQQLAFERKKAHKDTLRTPDDNPLPDSILRPWLGDMQRPSFEQMFSLDHAALRAGAAGILSAKDDVGRMLFQSASGLEQLGRVLQGLEAEAESLWGPRRAGHRLYTQAQDDLKLAQQELKASQTSAKSWKTQRDALAQIEQQLADLRQQRDQARHQRDRLERVRRVVPWLQRHDAAVQALQELGAVPAFPEQAAEQLADTDRELALAEAEARRCQTAIEEAHRALQTLPPDAPCLALAAEIIELDERRMQYRAHRPDMEKREAEVQTHWQAVQASAKALGWDASSVQTVRERLPDAALRAALAELLQAHGVLWQNLQFAQTQVHARQQECAHLDAEQQHLASSIDHTALGVALAHAQQLGDHEGQRQALQQQLIECQSALAVELQALGVDALHLPLLQAMLVPDATEVQALLQAQRADQAALEAAQNQHQQQQAELARLQLVLKQSVEVLPPVTRQQVLQARQARDDYWQQCAGGVAHASAAWPTQALQYQQLVTQADSLADDRLERLEQEAQYLAQTQRLELLHLELTQQAQRGQQLAQRLQERQRQWQSLVQACHLPVDLPLLAAPDWLERRAQALTLHQQLGRLQRQYDDGIQTGQQAHATLIALLGLADGALPEGAALPRPSLAECMVLARQRLDEAERQRGQRDTLRQQASTARRALQHLQAERDDAQRHWQQWQQQWQPALRQAGYSSDTEPATLRTALEAMERISSGLERMDTIRIERIEAMRADLDALAAAVHPLCQRLAPELLGTVAEDQVGALRQRLSAAQEVQAQRQRGQQALAQARTGLQQAQQRQTQLQAGLAGLYALLGSQADSHSAAARHHALARAVAQAAQARQYRQELAQAQARLHEQGDGLPVESLRAEVQALPLADIPAALQALDAQEQQWQAHTEELSAAAQQARTALAVFDGTHRAADAEARRQDAIARMTEAAQRYVQVHTAARWLHWTVARFRETQQGPMLALASQIFSQLTLGAFDRLVVDAEGDKPRLYGHRAHGALVGVEGLSEGARDQLYLALRLAALEMQVQPGCAMPFVADDLFINFDDQRTSAGLQALGQLARKTQVIFLTHHEHLVPLAQQALGAGLNVLPLPP